MNIYILGAGGLASEVFDLVIRKSTNIILDDIIFVVSEEYANTSKLMPIKILPRGTNPDWFNGIIFRGVGDMSFVKEKLFSIKDNIRYSLLSEKSYILGNYDTGVIAFPNTYTSGTSSVGKHVILYPNSVIHHDVTVGDGSIIASNSTLLGKCRVGSFTWIGAGSVILPNVSVGDWCVIGAGSVVTKDVGSNKTVMGIPAREVQNSNT